MSDIAQHVLSLFTSSPPRDDTAQVPAETTTAIAQDSNLPSLAALRTRVAHILTVFDDPRYAHLDVPNWVHRAAPQAHHDQRHAGTQVLARDGQRCVVSGVWDMPSRVRAPLATRWGRVNTVRIFNHPLVVYKDVYDRDKTKRESVLLSLEVIRRFCELDSRYFDLDSGGASVMDDPANLISLCCDAHAKFDAFGLCFVPMQTSTSPSPPGSPHHGAGASLPSRELLRAHAALGSVLYANDAALASVFEWIEEPLSCERLDVSELVVPDPDGASFWRDLVVDSGSAGRSASLAECEPDLDEFARVLGVASLPTA
ncbi:hypothetical protein GSI_12343 [Ganoderma sinense ZZ0214-1]|uniref:HNH nuclease domain-containing protein n=1 Tax=Ganoderma sinense ZZ0214-1 TaxID=1077348 RepID=A0A2G8RYK4_9APHY|nr:hypothetical protein GSI_12343 [Ganoderma sinense ZZ0214-1]